MELLNESIKVLNGYNNLEFDLEKASRGSRNAHASELLKYLCGAEDVLVVNNNAAAVVLILRAFAKGKDVIVSRGELIEIGGSFRLPDIIASSDCRMREVGTTNKTKVSDYEKAISDQTGVLFKAHKSNYSIEGFTQEVSLDELVELGRRKKIPVVYDMGSGLLNNNSIKEFKNEPNVKQTLKLGVDLVCFSGDKLLGGPQAGIIAGKKKLIERLKKEPLLRALRVDKLTLAFLETNNRYFLDESVLNQKNLFYKLLNQSQQELEDRATKCKKLLAKYKIDAEVFQSKGQYGGGALPGKEIDSFAIKLNLEKDTARQRSELAEMIFKELLQQKIPILGILRKGKIYFDMLCIPDEEIELVSETIVEVHKQTTG
jgi:L-seryl-tRNA(Ser) seleniumtransferase